MLIADQDVYQSLAKKFHHTNISMWETRNRIEIYAYDIIPKLPQLEQLINSIFSHAPKRPNFQVEKA